MKQIVPELAEVDCGEGLDLLGRQKGAQLVHDAIESSIEVLRGSAGAEKSLHGDADRKLELGSPATRLSERWEMGNPKHRERAVDEHAPDATASLPVAGRRVPGKSTVTPPGRVLCPLPRSLLHARRENSRGSGVARGRDARQPRRLLHRVREPQENSSRNSSLTGFTDDQVSPKYPKVWVGVEGIEPSTSTV